MAAWFRSIFPARNAKNQPLLHQRFASIDDFRGWSYAAVINRIGLRASASQFRSDGNAARTWTDGEYSITLLFDRSDICLGVEEENN